MSNDGRIVIQVDTCVTILFHNIGGKNMKKIVTEKFDVKEFEEDLTRQERFLEERTVIESYQFFLGGKVEQLTNKEIPDDPHPSARPYLFLRINCEDGFSWDFEDEEIISLFAAVGISEIHELVGKSIRIFYELVGFDSDKKVDIQEIFGISGKDSQWCYKMSGLDEVVSEEELISLQYEEYEESFMTDEKWEKFCKQVKEMLY